MIAIVCSAVAVTLVILFAVMFGIGLVAVIVVFILAACSVFK